MDCYQIEATKEQLELIMKALDFHSRIQMGQVSELTNPYSIPLPNTNYTKVENKIIDLKQIMFPELKEKEFYSIKSKKLSDSIRQEVDILDVIRYKLAWDTTTEENPSGSQFKPPLKWSNEMDLIKIIKVDK
jgi:hypothetical protein